uniref:Tyrosine-protein kinase n=1 Tax=Parastrongyloides trichosuri TaxID=131310 RepID=A0A0N4ZKM2_PARTI
MNRPQLNVTKQLDPTKVLKTSNVPNIPPGVGLNTIQQKIPSNQTMLVNKNAPPINKMKKKLSAQSQMTIVDNKKSMSVTGKPKSLQVTMPINPMKQSIMKNRPSKSKKSSDVSIQKTLKLENFEDFNMSPDMIKITIKELIQFPWFHGLLPRDEVEDILKNEGDFLVRKSEVNEAVRFVLSVKSKDSVVHVVLNWRDGEWYVGKTGGRYNSLDDLLKTYVKNGTQFGTANIVLNTFCPKPNYYINHSDVVVEKEIGRGAFGVVYKGTVNVDGKITKCAIKSLKIGKKIDKKQRREFIKEAKINLKLKHENIVNLIGFAINEEPLMIVLEFCEHGALNSYLKKRPETSNAICSKFVIDACRGMCYLSGKNIIHRDLAARNCLIAKDLIVKISDFGLSVANVVSITLNTKTKVPIRWLSPETINNKEFNLSTDVWSFGVVIWEIFSRCQSEPYPLMNNHEAKAVIVSNKPPMLAPPNTPPEIQNVMNACFIRDPKRRPSFKDLLKILSPNEMPPCDTVFCTY